MRCAAAFVLLVALGACAPRQDNGQAAQASAAPGQASVPGQAPAPVLLQYRTADRGGPSAYPEARVSGILDLFGPCVRLQDSRGGMTTVVSSPGPRLGEDSAGLYIQSGAERLRHGSSITGGGGWFDNFPGGLGQLDRPIPDMCRSGPYVVVTGMQRYDPADMRPPKSPPPPPSG